MTREKTIENAIKKHLDKVGAYYIKYHGGAYSKVGVPDLLVCYKGRFLGLEVKNETYQPSPLQLHHLKMIKKAGGIAYVVRSVAQLKLILEEVDND